MYAALSGNLPVPEILDSRPGFLALEYQPYGTMLDLLEEQEKGSFAPEPWEALASWLRLCHQLYGKLPSEGNLRNFLWNAKHCQIIGLDLESYRTCALSAFGAVLIAALMEYRPADTPVKQQAAHMLAEEWGVSEPAIAAERQSLRARRGMCRAQKLSGIVLAGGESSRMGRNKVQLPLLGKTLLQWQVEKLRALGIQDIMISGEGCDALPDTRVIPDQFPHRGPLGGLHACLRAARHPQCLVLSVDAPLVPVSALAHLCRCHSRGVTVLRHAEKQELLIGVYDSTLSETISEMIVERGAPAWALSEKVALQCFDYLGPEVLLKNCNTPQDFCEVREIAMEYAERGYY